MIFPGLFHELKTQSKYPEMFYDIKSSPSRYELPSYINADKLIEEIRSSVASALVFIHTWILENSHLDACKNLLEKQYLDYASFFEEILSFIISVEVNSNVRDLAYDLRSSIKKISQHLGSYHGSMKEIVFRTYDILTIISVIMYATRLCNMMSMTYSPE
ncbi:Hypothetical protein HVR_LOCUS217 [uncultured virus]|nr:Hypothetical protein HVR_LOCUS217 [uncultured virus]